MTQERGGNMHSLTRTLLVALLVLALVACTGAGEEIPSPTPTPSPPPALTGIAEVDAVIRAVLSGELESIRELTRYTFVECETDPQDIAPPKCRPDEPLFTPVQVLPVAECELRYVRADLVDETLTRLVELEPSLYAVYRSPPREPPGQYIVVFSVGQAQHGVAGIEVAVDDGRLAAVDFGCGKTPEQLVKTVLPQDYVLTPTAPISTSSASPLPSATIGPLLVYTREVGEVRRGRRWPIWAVVTYDVGAKHEVASFEVGRYGEFPRQVVIAGDKLIANLEWRVVLYDIDGSNPRVLREVPEGGEIIRIAPSPDATILALTEAPKGVLKPDSTYAVVFLDIASGEELLTVSQRPEAFDGFAGHVACITWREDGSGVAVYGWMHAGAPGGTATVLLVDGTVTVHHLTGWPLLSPNGLYAWHGPTAHTCMPECFPLNDELILRDLASDTDILSLSESGLILHPHEWSPDATEVLYAAYSARPSEHHPDCVEHDPSTARWYLLHLDGFEAEPVDRETVLDRWYGPRRVRFYCLGEPVEDGSCRTERGTDTDVEIYVGDAKIGTGKEVYIVGFIGPEGVTVPRSCP